MTNQKKPFTVPVRMLTGSAGGKLACGIIALLIMLSLKANSDPTNPQRKSEAA